MRQLPIFSRVDPKQISGEQLGGYIVQIVTFSVGKYHITDTLEFIEVADHTRVEKVPVAKVGLVDHDLDAFGFDAFHDALDAGRTEVVGAGFHDEAVDAYDGG